QGLTCHRMVQDLERLGELRRIEGEIASESGRLRERLGQRFLGIETAWDKLLEAVQWAARFMAHMAHRAIPESLLNIMVAGKEKAPQGEGLESDLKRVGGAFGKLGDKFASGFPAMNGVPLGEVDFVGMLSRLREMLQEIGLLGIG
ncbi:MAG: hypothetical protein ACREBQ_10745, partial [Nitrososphaerales archaeon]